MRNITCIKHINYLKQNILNFYNKNKGLIYFFIIFGFFGLIFGISSSMIYKDSITIEHIFDTKFILFLTKECSFFSIAISHFIKQLMITLLILILCFNRVTKYISFILIAYYGFTIGLNVTVIIVCFKFFGILHILLCYLPFFILQLVLFCILFCYCDNWSNVCYSMKKCNYFLFKWSFVKDIILILVLLFIINILECLLYNITTVTFIVIT